MTNDDLARVQVLLAAWGRRAIKSASGALGYPTTSPMFRDAPKGDSFGSVVPVSIALGRDDLDAVGAAVDLLPTVQRVTVVEVYQRGGAMRAIAERMGVKRDALNGWLYKAHAAVLLAIDGKINYAIDSKIKGVQNARQFDSV